MSGRISGQREHQRRDRREGGVGGDHQPGADAAAPCEASVIPDRRTNRSARRYLLARLLRCGLCGTKLVSRPRADGSRRYVCASGPGFGGCGKIAIVADPLERFIVEAVLHRLDSPELRATLNGTPDDARGGTSGRRRSSTPRRSWTSWPSCGARQEISRREWLAARARSRSGRRSRRSGLPLLNRTTALARTSGNADGLRERWAGMKLTRQEQIVAAVLDHVVVAPARRGYNRFDPSRLAPVWRA